MLLHNTHEYDNNFQRHGVPCLPTGRHTILKKQTNSMKINHLYLSLLAFLLAGPVLAKSKTNTKTIVPERVINVDFNNEKGPLNTMFKECVGAGRANEGLRADWQQQLAYVKKTCDFKYIRMHGLLTDDMAVYKEDDKGNPQYNYMYIDALYDYLLSIGIKPFVELGFMPSWLASGNKTIFWWKGNVTPPKDYGKWEDFIRNLTQHFTERYGADEVKAWYFEVWNEPNLDGFWAGTQDEYFKLYSYTVKAIKRVNPEYKVGGPGTAGAAWEPEMISYCHANNLPLDFISTHSYGVKQGFLDEFGQSGTVLSKNPLSVSGDVLNSRKEITESSMPNLELHYTEWSSSYTPSDPIHDSYHEAAYILEKIKQVGTAANSMSYWVFTDIFEEAGPRFESFHGGFGLLTIQGINKPAFYAYNYLNKLGKTELTNADSRSWASKDDDGGIQLLFWDFTNTHPGDSVHNQKYYIQDLPAKPKGKVKVNLSHVPSGKYTLEIYKVGYRVNDAHTSYIDMGRPTQLNKQQVEELKKQNDGSPVLTELIDVDDNGFFSKEFDIRENDVIMLSLAKR
jgi:xylan 1,4-beta-xylosidase